MSQFQRAFLSWVSYLVPDRHEKDEKFRRYLSRLSRIGMIVAGILCMVAVGLLVFTYTVVAKKNPVWSYHPSLSPDDVTLFDKLLIFLIGLLCLLLARLRSDAQAGRIMIWILMIAAGYITVYDDILRGNLTQTSGYLILILLIGAGAMPYRPWQVTLSGISIILIYTFAVRCYPGGAVEQPEDYSLMIMATVLGTVITGYLYQARHRLYQSRQKEITLRNSLAQYADDLRKANVKLGDTRAQLIQSEKMAALGNLVAGVAHEINSPLGSIGANADTCRRALHRIKTAVSSRPEFSDARLTRVLDTLVNLNQSVTEATRRIDAIVTALRNFAGLDEGEYQSVDLNHGLEDTLTLLRTRRDFKVDVVKDFGALSEIYCRPRQLNQVFMNIITNALEAMEGGGRLTIRTRGEGERVRIQISDDGRGIPPEHLGRVFEPGFTTKGRGVGTGLGLSICFRIVEDHGGTLDIESQLGKGTTVSMEFPLKPPETV